MYFPLLRRLNNFHIDSLAINSLDSWLAIQRKAVLTNLSPLRFSGQTDINLELAIDMFLLAAAPDIGILKTKYKVICPVCEAANGTYYSLQEIPNIEVQCKHCEFHFVPNERLDYVEIVFERCINPAKDLVSEAHEKTGVSKDTFMGKGGSLRVDDLIKGSSSARRRLLMGLDTRYEAAQ